MSEAEALLALLDDPDPALRRTLVRQLLDDAELRERVWTASAGRPLPTALCETMVQADALDLVEEWGSAEDLEEGWPLLARLQVPRTDPRPACSSALDALATRAPRGDAGAVARWLCEDCGFAGDREAFDDPRNSQLADALERRAGLPIAVTGIWLLTCRRLGLQARALALPAHVFAAWEGGAWDCFSGTAVSSEDLDRWARAHGAASAEPYLAGADDRELLQRMARNLTAAYARRGELVRAAVASLLARS
jgi:hypothetical protein